MEDAPVSSKGKINKTGFTYENIAKGIEDTDIVEIKTIIRGHDKEISLTELVVKKAD